MDSPIELTFTNILTVYDALWDLGGRVVQDPSIGNKGDWLLAYRNGLRGMLARIYLVDHHYDDLQRYLDEQDKHPGNPNAWAIECECHAGAILFGMVSSTECLVFALNALGYAKDSAAFVDITDVKALRTISLKNILGGDLKDKSNPKPGYQKHLPSLVSYWKKSENLMTLVSDYHNVSKHRSSVATGGKTGGLHIRAAPSSPLDYSSHPTETLQTLAVKYQDFIVELLPIALRAAGLIFGLNYVGRPIQ